MSAVSRTVTVLGENARMDFAPSEVFELQGWRFELGVRPMGEFFQPVAICRSGTAEAVHLTEDAAPYATAAEALRHARQRAMRYATHQ